MSNIPKIIHYCWFGRNPLPERAVKCIASWKKYFPDYEIIEWNEDNYDINKIRYTREAYEAKKYAFVSDYARFDILYKYGGIYFDTDVEVIKSFDDILAKGAFMGCERDGDFALAEEDNQERWGKYSQINCSLGIAVAPGLGIAAPLGLSIYREILDYYGMLSFKNSDGSNNMTTIVDYTMRVLKRHGLKNIKGIQLVDEITIYPQEYFAPKNIDTKELKITSNTYSIHHYDASWAEWYDKAAGERGPKLKKMFGNRVGAKLNVIIYVFQKYGAIGWVKKLFRSKGGNR